MQTILAASALTLAGCSDILDGIGLGSSDGGTETLAFSVEVPDPIQVQTRSVDPDGKGIQTLRLFCFDQSGTFISTATASLYDNKYRDNEDDDGMVWGGSFSADVMSNTKTVHLLANQNMDNFVESNYVGLPEDDVIGTLIASGDRMIYWGRVSAVSGTTVGDITTAMQNASPIQLVRNHAKITIPENNYFSVYGLTVANSSAYGTSAPYNRNTQAFDFIDNPKYMTIPDNEGRTSLPADMTDRDEWYIFESYNYASDPISVIVKGHNISEGDDADDKYHRILIIDENGDPLDIIRHHWYKLNITGELQYPYNTIKEAYNGVAENNVFASVSSEINSISDGTYTLSVDDTYVVLCEEDYFGTSETNTGNGVYTVKYSYIANETSSGVSADEAPTVTWVDGNDVAYNTLATTYDTTTGEGSVTISLVDLDENTTERTGTLLIRSGKLSRTVTVKMIHRMTFIPSWISSNAQKEIDSYITLMFTIPEDCPEELFPLRVLISAGDVYIRSSSGQQLDVVTESLCKEDNEDYGEDYNELGYKYVYWAESAGVQSVYFSLTDATNTSGKVYIENPYFETMEREYTLYIGTDAYQIGLTNLGRENIANATSLEEDFISFRRVAPKVNAFVPFELGIYTDNSKTDPVDMDSADEFMIFTTYLSPITTDTGTSQVTNPENENDTYTREANITEAFDYDNGNSGKVYGIWQRGSDVDKDGKLDCYMQTNTAMTSKGVVRVTSNLTETSFADNSTYSGNTYKSRVFELRPYDPFEFASSVSVGGSTGTEWAYGPDQEVSVAFDITSYPGEGFIYDPNTKTTDTTPVDVSPFGTSFRVYIDAPMLEIDGSKNTLSSDKFYADETTSGRFVYVVDASRSTEASSAASTTTQKQPSTSTYTTERKELHFKTSGIINSGTISISADPSVVIYDTETYEIEDSPITGTIKYTDTSGTTLNVPSGSFVSFSRVRDDTRIGSVSVNSDGTYSLYLKSEYSYTWDSDETVEFEFKVSNDDGTKTYYSKTLANLKTLMSSPNVTLTETTTE